MPEPSRLRSSPLLSEDEDGERETLEELKARLAAPLLPMLVPVPPAGGGGSGECSVQLILRYPAPCRVVPPRLLTTYTNVSV